MLWQKATTQLQADRALCLGLWSPISVQVVCAGNQAFRFSVLLLNLADVNGTRGI